MNIRDFKIRLEMGEYDVVIIPSILSFIAIIASGILLYVS